MYIHCIKTAVIVRQPIDGLTKAFVTDALVTRLFGNGGDNVSNCRLDEMFMLVEKIRLVAVR